MGFLDRLFGAPEERPARTVQPVPPRPMGEDELAIERYRYLLRTAPPEAIEQVHAEAFAKLTPAQRHQVYQALADQAPAGERLVSEEPGALARAATRQELRQPGSMERAFATANSAPGSVGAYDAAGGGRGGQPGYGGPGGPSFGQMFGSSLLGTVAGVVLGSMIAQAFLPDPGVFEASDPGAGGEGAADAGAADAGSVEAAGGDVGGFGGDFGGGDFGGGDFGDFGF